jgi:hypothetical protein
MATVVKDFKVKAGLIVEGTTAKVNNFDILTKSTNDQNYIVGLIGGSATAAATPDTVVLRDENGSFAANVVTADLSGNVTGNVLGNVTGDVTGNADTASALATSRTIELTGDVIGSVGFDGTSNVQISTTIDADFATDAEVATAKSEAIAAANSYTDDEINALTTTDIGEGNNLYFTDERARAAVDAGDGLDYNSTTGVFSADLGNGLQFDSTGQIEIDDNVVATDQDVADAVEDHSDLTTGVHGVTGDVVGTDDVQTLENKELGSGTTLGSNIDADGNTITNLAEPAQASDAATKGYVDAVAEGLHIHASVVAATAENIDLSTGGLLTIDGVALSAGDRVLVKDQTDPAENGIYVAASGAWTRAEDHDTAAEVQAGDFVFVSGGNTYASTGWVQENNVNTLGTDPITWDQFSGAGTFTAGNGLTLTGTQFAIDTAVTATKTHVADKVTEHSNLTTGIHGVTGDVVGTSDTQTLTNKTLGTGTVLGANLDGTNTHKVVNLVDPTSAQDAATKKYVDDEIVTVNNTINGLDTDDITEAGNLYFTDGRAVDAVAAAINGGIQTNIDVTFDSQTGKFNFVAENGVDDSTTDDLDEGNTNLYFSDERAQDAVAAAIAAGTHENIVITYDDNANSISFVAENGVADSDTDDLDEGTTNLYFTDARAVSALEAVVPNFTEIDINSVATQVAATSTVETASQAVAYIFDGGTYRSAKFIVKVAYGTHTEVSEVLLTLDTSDNIAITEYAVVGTNGSASTISAGMNGTNVELLVTTANNNSTITVMGTLLV